MDRVKTKTIEQFRVTSKALSDPLVVETREQLDRFVETAREFGGVQVQRQTVTVTESGWEAYEVDQP
ncbi:hypothetical protein SEA_DARDANUS_53 [Gordonia phage Dardanus]|uniref:Uncharacterized protein n=1 Tax=Gordonia phage Dardanus TaxID=2588489 RepID=A0A514CX63_9CAUD|nr:hypothetical protein KDJ58_gp53 [Gordonia phage Dardanus]QDH85090.1 hypothetical protein SEA_DARDANUS_53 [Gordonia phage Dardanus]